jgi:hypothetical protein
MVAPIGDLDRPMQPRGAGAAVRDNHGALNTVRLAACMPRDGSGA